MFKEIKRMDTIFYPFDHLDRLFPKLKTCNQKGILATYAAPVEPSLPWLRLNPMCLRFS